MELLSFAGIHFPNNIKREQIIMRSLLLWMIGIPIPIIILIWLFV